MPTPIFYKINLTGGSFQNPSGNALSLGYLEWRLNHDSNICILGGPFGSQVVAGITVKTYLDMSGNIISGSLWPNDQLTPSGSYYTVRAFDMNGIEIWAVPQIFILQGYVSGQVVDVGTLTPVQP
jgi:hypothetical protein